MKLVILQVGPLRINSLKSLHLRIFRNAEKAERWQAGGLLLSQQQWACTGLLWWWEPVTCELRVVTKRIGLQARAGRAPGWRSKGTQTCWGSSEQSRCSFMSKRANWGGLGHAQLGGDASRNCKVLLGTRTSRTPCWACCHSSLTLDNWKIMDRFCLSTISLGEKKSFCCSFTGRQK